MNDDKKPRNHGRPAFVDRRKKNDWVVHMATILSILSWLVAFTVLFVLEQASPEKETILERMFGITVRDYWNSSLLPIAFILLVISLCFCIFAFIFNMLRKRRKTDKYKKSIIIIGAITLIGIVIFMIRFGLPY